MESGVCAACAVVDPICDATAAGVALLVALCDSRRSMRVSFDQVAASGAMDFLLAQRELLPPTPLPGMVRASDRRWVRRLEREGRTAREAHCRGRGRPLVDGDLRRQPWCPARRRPAQRGHVQKELSDVGGVKQPQQRQCEQARSDACGIVLGPRGSAAARLRLGAPLAAVPRAARRWRWRSVRPTTRALRAWTRFPLVLLRSGRHWWRG